MVSCPELPLPPSGFQIREVLESRFSEEGAPWILLQLKTLVLVIKKTP